MVTSPVFQKLWDSFTFSEFLNGRYQKDEILYFLNSRYLILLGLEQDTRGTAFDIYSYIPDLHVQHFLDQMRVEQRIERKEDFLLQRLFEMMPKSTKRTIHRNTRTSVTSPSKNLVDLARTNAESINQMTGTNSADQSSTPLEPEPVTSFFGTEIVTHYVDLYQVLRLLLEEYRASKISRFLTYFELVNQGITRASKNERQLEFSTFQLISQKFYSSPTTLQMIQTFRLAVSLGRGSISIESLYSAGENSGVFACVEKFGVLGKYGYTNRLQYIKKGALARMEQKFNWEEQNVKALAVAHGKTEQVPRSDLDYLQSVLMKTVENHGSDTVLRQRAKVSEWAGTLGSLNLFESYEKAVLSMSDPHPRSVHLACSLSLFLGRYKRLETQILEFREALTMNLHGTYTQEFGNILDLVGENRIFERVQQLERRKNRQLHAKNTEGRYLKAAFVRLLHEWYKTYSNLLNFKNAAKGSTAEPGESAGPSGKKKTTGKKSAIHLRKPIKETFLDISVSSRNSRKSSAVINPDA